LVEISSNHCAKVERGRIMPTRGKSNKDENDKGNTGTKGTNSDGKEQPQQPINGKEQPQQLVDGREEFVFESSFNPPKKKLVEIYDVRFFKNFPSVSF